jgi:membrane associated rhomboid family serine protease
MSASTAPPFETLLQMIARAAPRPWYPVDFVNSNGVPKEKLEAPLDQLRLAGLIAFTPWVAGKGQGYELTPYGAEVVASPRAMAGVRRGYLPAAREVEPEEEIDPHVEGTVLGRGDKVRRALLNRQPPKLTKILIIINVIVFGVGVVIGLRNGVGMNALLAGPDVRVPAQREVLQLTGAVTGGDIMKGEWWRLLTCCFVHFGGLHLAMNMYSLWVLGSVVENMWGRARFFTIYILAGLGGSCAAIWFHPNSNLAGASGAIWGLLASYPAWLIANRAYLPPQFVSQALRSLVPVIAINACISFIPGISWQAHFGGGIVGAVVAVLLNQHRFGRDPVRWMWIGAVAIIPVLCVGALLQKRESNPRWKKEAKEAKGNNRDLSADDEIDDFNQKHIKTVSTVRNLVDRVVGQAEVARTKAQPKAQRDAALTANQDARARVDAAARQIENAGPYESQRMRDMVKVILAAFRHDKAVLDLCEQSLTGEWVADDDERLVRALDNRRTAWLEYDKRLAE